MKIKVTLGTIEKAIKQIEQYEKSLERKFKTLIEKLAQIGVATADMRFKSAQYDGLNDVVVGTEWQDDKLILYAKGKSVNFIEFGSGVHYSESHPLAEKLGAIRGEFGQGKGKNDSWAYYGDESSGGTSGRAVRVTKDGRVVYRTRGNPPARAMYEASKEIREQIVTIAKEVFKT